MSIKRWLGAEHTYTVRFGIEMLMCHFLDDDFDPEHLHLVMNVPEGEYYVDMMVAWYFATALAKQWDETVKILQQRALSEWRHNKTVSKACESLRISKGQKIYLKGLADNHYSDRGASGWIRPCTAAYLFGLLQERQM